MATVNRDKITLFWVNRDNFQMTSFDTNEEPQLTLWWVMESPPLTPKNSVPIHPKYKEQIKLKINLPTHAASLVSGAVPTVVTPIRFSIGGTSIINVLYSFAKKIGAVAFVYLLGYFEFSVAWLIGPVILSVIRDEWKKEHELRRNVAKAAALCNEKEVILARVDDLPSWVFFPDVERAEWLNRILRQVWPNVNHYAKTLIKETIEPNVRTSLEAYKLNGFRFEKMILGSIPIRIGGVKVYDRNVSRNEIIMDMDIFYAGDCDISFSIGGIKGGIKDFQIHGMVRVVMKPLIRSMPLVGGLQVFFLNNPTLDFNLVGMADLLDMPGLSDILRRIIVEQVANIMVLPNKLPIVLSDEVPATILKMPEPEGVLRVHVVEAKQLMNMDFGGKSDPYAIITVGAQEFRTQTINNTINPKWDFWCETARKVVEQYTTWNAKYGMINETMEKPDISLNCVSSRYQFQKYSFSSACNFMRMNLNGRGLKPYWKIETHNNSNKTFYSIFSHLSLYDCIPHKLAIFISKSSAICNHIHYVLSLMINQRRDVLNEVEKRHMPSRSLDRWHQFYL
ncbi:hypothetical protein L9F63_027246, partial [Diploptera punctata]